MSAHHVLIVGGGPVGLALAVDLGLRGVSCQVLESRTHMAKIPKGQGLTQRSLEHFYFWGLDQALRAARLMPQGYPIGEITAYQNLTSPYWQAPAGRELVEGFFYQAQERLPQYCMEQVLRQKIAELPHVKFRIGVSAQDLQLEAAGTPDQRVRLEVTNEQGQLETLHARYLVGCDGGHSMVRRSVGLERSGTQFNQTMVLLVFRSKDLHARLSRYPERSTYRVMAPESQGYWRFFGRIDVGEGFFFHMPIAEHANREVFDFRQAMFEAAGFEFDCEIEHEGFWELRNAVATRYQEGPVFIAGDAAHSHPPYGGYGLNNGLEDAVNLSWKLTARLQGWGGTHLLDSYSLEREPVFREVAENFIAARIREDGAFLERYNPQRNRPEFEAAWNARITDVGSRRLAYEPNYESSPIVEGAGGQTSAHGVHMHKARAGHHLSPQVLSGGRNVYQELGRGFTLLALGADGSAFEAQAQAMGIPLKLIHDAAPALRQNYEAALVLVRPDQHVAWVGESVQFAEAAATVLKKASGQ
jgi:2-polyprenyl-6-methoxyphenol hydroxylase-like FAD-dependent oxidoreductase